MKDSVVVGAGMVGLSVALALQARGQDVALVDPCRTPDGASYGNAGVVSPGSILPMAGPGLWPNLTRYVTNRDPGLRIRYRDAFYLLPWGLRFMRASNAAKRDQTVAQLATLVSRAVDSHRALADDLGVSAWLRPNGWLRAFRTQAGFEAAAAERRLLTQHGVAFDVVQAAQIRELEPGLKRHFDCGVLLTGALSIDQPGRLIERALAVFRERGGAVVEAAASALVPVADGVRVVTPAGEVQARHAVLAAGVWSAQLAQALGYRFPMVGERGYHVHQPLPEGIVLNRPLNDVSGAHVMAPEPGGIRVLSGVEVARPDSPPNLAQLGLAVAQAAQTWGVPAVSLDKVGEGAGDAWLGSRPSMPDGLPVIGAAPRHARIVFAFGHGHIGLSTGPITGQLVAELITGQAPSIPLAPFAPQRFVA